MVADRLAREAQRGCGIPLGCQREVDSLPCRNATEPDDHLHQFHIYGKNYGISYSGGIAFPYNPYKITLDDFEFDAGDRFTYEYNFYVQIA
ncbi:hypothetical protein [Xenorhabdus bovienii]|uniref:hypothetical protein n=1 Tax=Xenorhabdus bovienii TaxID=40576 RepID=UPI0023B25108|nr:hypothetical protein [Xenorhabdus bovienii]